MLVNSDILISICLVLFIISLFLAIKIYLNNNKFRFELETLRLNLQNKDDEVNNLNHRVNSLNSNLAQEIDLNKDLEKKAAILETNLRNQLEKQSELKARLERDLQEIKEENKNDVEKLNSQQKQREDELMKRVDNQIKLIGEKMLNLNSEKISESSKILVSQTLENQIKPLKEEIEKYQKENNALNVIFRENFDNLKQESANMMKQAALLTDALKGNKKAAGNWGEMQLDAVLESSGLKLGENYEKQVYYIDKDGNNKFLDATIDFGDGKKAIIDAKCPLTHYLEYCNSGDDAQKSVAASELAKAIKAHIDGLNSKEYKDYAPLAYEYVFMFIPNDAMLYTAMNSDGGLYQYAYDRGIFITTPLTLLMALKTVYICWRNLKSDENIIKITIAAGKLYDKFAGFLDDFEKIGANLDRTAKSFADSRSKLIDGRGNVIKQIEDVKKLGAKASKTIKIEFDDKDNADLLVNSNADLLAFDMNLEVNSDTINKPFAEDG